MPYYDIAGKGIITGRARHSRYLADDVNHAISLANRDETEVISIKLVEAGSATEKQIKFAKDLGLSFSEEINEYEIGNLLDCELENDTVAPRWLLEYVWKICPSQKGLLFTKYVGLNRLISFLHSSFFNDKNEKEMVHWFLYFVVRDYFNIDWSMPINKVYGDYHLEGIESELLNNESVIKSIKRYSYECMLRFGEYTLEDGHIVAGGSKRTTSYKEVVSLLEKAGTITTVHRKSRILGRLEKSNVNSNSGCLGIVIIIVLAPMVLYL